MLSKKIVFMGGKQVGCNCLLFLLENAQKLNIEVVAVFEYSVSALASKENSLTKVLEGYDIPIYNDKKQLFKIKTIDFIFSIQYGQILLSEEIALAKILAVNLHMAPLPEYRGCNQFSFAIIDNAKEFGTTLHILEAGIDAGAILFEKRFDIEENIFVTDLYNKTYKESINLFKENIGHILNGSYTPISQKSLIPTRGTSIHYRREIETVKHIDVNWPVKKQKRYFRATFFPVFSPPVLVSGDNQTPLTLDWYNKQS